jgi:hypothetical protein
VQLLLHPPCHHQVVQAGEVVAVHVRDEHRRDVGRSHAGFGHAQHGGATGVELQAHVATPHERAGARSPRRRVRHTGAGQVTVVVIGVAAVPVIVRISVVGSG